MHHRHMVCLVSCSIPSSVGIRGRGEEDGPSTTPPFWKMKARAKENTRVKGTRTGARSRRFLIEAIARDNIDSGISTVHRVSTPLTHIIEDVPMLAPSRSGLCSVMPPLWDRIRTTEMAKIQNTHTRFVCLNQRLTNPAYTLPSVPTLYSSSAGTHECTPTPLAAPRSFPARQHSDQTPYIRIIQPSKESHHRPQRHSQSLPPLFLPFSLDSRKLRGSLFPFLFRRRWHGWEEGGGEWCVGVSDLVEEGGIERGKEQEEEGVERSEGRRGAVAVH
jgi:hypothetical protein